MALTTTELRRAWDPPCRGTEQSLQAAYSALDGILQKHNYRPRYGVTGAYNCRRITGGTGYSLHAYGPDGFFTFWTGVRVSKALAVDINWDTNPYGPRLITDMPRAMVDEIKALRTGNGKQVWRWGGDYGGNKDAMHYEIVCTPADLATGVKNPALPTPPPTHDGEDDKVYALVQRANVDSSGRITGPADDHWWWTDWMNRRYIDDPKEAGRLAFRVRANGGKVETGNDPQGGVVPVLVPAADVDSMPRIA